MISLGRVREVVRKEFRQIARDPRLGALTLLAPVIQLVVFGYAVNTDLRRISMFVVDQDRTPVSRALVDAFTANGYFEVVGRSDASRDIVRVLDHGRALIALEIPPGFASDVRQGRAGDVQILLDGTESNSATIAQGYAARIMQRFELSHAGVMPEGVDLRARVYYNPGLESRMYNVPAVLGALLFLICLLLTALGVVREREIGTLDQLRVSPIRPAEFILGKTLPAALIALLDLVLITAVAVLWFGVPLRGSATVLLGAAVLFVATALAVGLLISTISNTQQEAFMTMFLVLLPSFVLSGLLYPVESMPALFQWVTMVNPLRHFLEIVRGVFLKGVGVQELATQFAALAVLAGLGMTLAIQRFHARMS